MLLVTYSIEARVPHHFHLQSILNHPLSKILNIHLGGCIKLVDGPKNAFKTIIKALIEYEYRYIEMHGHLSRKQDRIAN